jgi:hypothetical protein
LCYYKFILHFTHLFYGDALEGVSICWKRAATRA